MIFQIALLFTVGVGIILLLLTIAGATLYGIQHIKRQRHQSRHPHSGHYRQRPLISVIIPTLNDEKIIEHTLRSVTQSSYRKVEIIVVDRKSQDGTKQLVRHFIAAHPHRTIRLSAKRKPVSATEAATEASRKLAKGTLVFWLAPGQLLDQKTLIQAVGHFNTEPGLVALRCNRRVSTTWSIAGLFRGFELLLGHRFWKLNAISPADYTPTSAGNIYTREAFLVSPTFSRHRQVCYATDAIVRIPPPASFYDFLRQRYRLQGERLESLKAHQRPFFIQQAGRNPFLTWFRLSLAVCVGAAAFLIPLLLTYFIYLAVHLHQPALYVMSWVFITLFAVFAIAGDEHLSLRQKTSYTVLAPMLPGIVYLTSLTQLLVIFKVPFPTKTKY